MATEGGVRTTPFGTALGALEVGRAADMVPIDWQSISFPYLDVETPVLDAVIQRAKASAVRTVLDDGEVIYEDGCLMRVNRDAALRELSELLRRDLTDAEQERRWLSKKVLPYVKSFYDGYFDPASHQPHYRQSSRV